MSLQRGARTVNEPDPVLVLDDVHVHFGGVIALTGVSVATRPGEIVGIIGPNGAGKTTLFDVASGFCSPTSGRVRLGEHDVTAWSPTEIARAGMRRTFQQLQTFGWLSVADNVRVGLEWGSGRCLRVDVADRVDAALRRCGLVGVADVAAAGLPIGTARLVELARAIAAEPDVLLLDEPTSGLDAEQAATLRECIVALRRERGTSVVLVEHDVDFLLGVCDRVIVLNLGSVLAEGSPAEIRADEAVREAYLGQPAA